MTELAIRVISSHMITFSFYSTNCDCHCVARCSINWFFCLPAQLTVKEGLGMSYRREPLLCLRGLYLHWVFASYILASPSTPKPHTMLVRQLRRSTLD